MPTSFIDRQTHRLWDDTCFGFSLNETIRYENHSNDPSNVRQNLHFQFSGTVLEIRTMFCWKTQIYFTEGSFWQNHTKIRTLLHMSLLSNYCTANISASLCRKSNTATTCRLWSCLNFSLRSIENRAWFVASMKQYYWKRWGLVQKAWWGSGQWIVLVWSILNVFVKFVMFCSEKHVS